jgi:hypothetical protein
VQDVRDLCRIEGVRCKDSWMPLSLSMHKPDWHLPNMPAELLTAPGEARLWEALIRWAVITCYNTSVSWHLQGSIVFCLGRVTSAGAEYVSPQLYYIADGSVSHV